MGNSPPPLPKGTLVESLCFLCMIHDLETGCETVKCVDDTTIFHVTSDVGDKSLQVAISEKNRLIQCK